MMGSVQNITSSLVMLGWMSNDRFSPNITSSLVMLGWMSNDRFSPNTTIFISDVSLDVE